MSNVYFSSDYIPKKRETKESIIRDIENGRLKALNQQYSTSNNNVYQTAFIILGGGILLGCFSLLIWMAGRKSGKDSCRR